MPDELLVTVLGAGASRRLGYPKQLVSVGGEPLIRRVCRTAIEAAIADVLAGRSKRGRVPELWDGSAGERIAHDLWHWLQPRYQAAQAA